MADQRQQFVPESDLELNYLTIQPKWGETTVNPELIEKLRKKGYKRVKAGKIYHDPETGEPKLSEGNVFVKNEVDLWANLAHLTQDIRLANYGSNDYNACEHYFNLAGDFINLGYIEAASIALAKGALLAEMSQGKKGFLREMQQTFIKKSTETQAQEKKNTILNRGEKNNG